MTLFKMITFRGDAPLQTTLRGYAGHAQFPRLFQKVPSSGRSSCHLNVSKEYYHHVRQL